MEHIAHTPGQLAQILRGERKARGLNQEAAGERVSLLVKTVSKLENDPGRSQIDTLFRILSALDLELVVRRKDSESDERDHGLEW